MQQPEVASIGEHFREPFLDLVFEIGVMARAIPHIKALVKLWHSTCEEPDQLKDEGSF